MIKIILLFIIYLIAGIIVGIIVKNNGDRNRTSKTALCILFWPIFLTYFIISAIVQLLTLPFSD